MRHNPKIRRSRPKSRIDRPGPLRHAVYVSEGVVKSPRPAQERLAEGVIAARERLQLTQEEFAEKAGLSLKTVQRVENKRATPQAKTFNGLDQGAEWVPGGARLLYEEGREPVEIGRVAESAASGRLVGLLESWTDEEIERLRGATRQQIADEAASIAKFAGEDAHFRFLHDVALIKLASAGAARPV